MEDLEQVDRGWSLEKFELNQGIGIDAITDSQLCCFNEVPLYWVRNYFKGLQLATIISLSEDAILWKSNELLFSSVYFLIYEWNIITNYTVFINV